MGDIIQTLASLKLLQGIERSLNETVRIRWPYLKAVSSNGLKNFLMKKAGKECQVLIAASQLPANVAFCHWSEKILNIGKG